MRTSFEQEACYKAGEVEEIDLHIEFLREKLSEVLDQVGFGFPTDTDKNVIKITAKISALRRRKSKINAKIKELIS